MRMHDWIRRTHRWTSIVFTLAVLANFAVMGNAELGPWVGFATLLPLSLLLLSGLYLFAHPYLAKRATR
jgi:intracellular septation protein A